MSSKSVKQKDLALSDKVQVIKEPESKTLQKLVAAKFHASQSQVSRIWKTQKKISENHRNNINLSRKRARGSSQKDVDEVLLRWFTQTKSRGLQISGPMLQQKAKDLA